MKNTKNSPLNQDVKFDTTLHNYGKRAHLMTAKERSNYREGLGIALAFAPIPGAGIVGRVVGRVLGKTLQTSARNFSSAVKQFLGKGKVATKPRLVDQYHTVDRGAIKKFNQLQQSTSGSAKVPTKPSLVNQYHTVDRGAIKKFNQITKPAKVATKPKNPRLAAKAKGDMSYLSIAKADKSVANTFSERQSAYLKQQMKQREVGSASSRLQKTHKKAVGDFYAGKGPKIPPVKGKWWK